MGVPVILARESASASFDGRGYSDRQTTVRKVLLVTTCQLSETTDYISPHSFRFSLPLALDDILRRRHHSTEPLQSLSHAPSPETDKRGSTVRARDETPGSPRTDRAEIPLRPLLTRDAYTYCTTPAHRSILLLLLPLLQAKILWWIQQKAIL